MTRLRNAIGDYAGLLLSGLGSLLLILSMAISHARPAGDPGDVATFYRRMVAFDKKYQPMIQTACGFDGKEIPAANPMCDPLQGRIDSKQFEQAREEAKIFFQLDEKKH